MKTDKLSRKPASIAKTRWAAYATAGAASAFTCVNSAEATIHYSGIIHEFIGGCEDEIAQFQLDQPGDSFRLRHSNFLAARLAMAEPLILASAAGRGPLLLAVIIPVPALTLSLCPT